MEDRGAAVIGREAVEGGQAVGPDIEDQQQRKDDDAESDGRRTGPAEHAPAAGAARQHVRVDDRQRAVDEQDDVGDAGREGVLEQEAGDRSLALPVFIGEDGQHDHLRDGDDDAAPDSSSVDLPETGDEEREDRGQDRRRRSTAG